MHFSSSELGPLENAMHSAANAMGAEWVQQGPTVLACYFPKLWLGWPAPKAKKDYCVHSLWLPASPEDPSHGCLQ